MDLSPDPRLRSKPNEQLRLPDGRAIWLSRSVAALGIVICFDQASESYYVAVSRRGPSLPDYRGCLAICGGYLDWDESLSGAAVREVWEEVGLNLYQFADLGEVEISDQPIHVSSNPSTDARQNVTVRFLFQLKCASLPKLSTNNSEPGEASEAIWLRLSEESLAADKFAFNHRQILQELFTKLCKPKNQ